MTVSYKLKDGVKTAKLEQSSYRILGYGDQLHGSKLYLFANDDLEIISIIESAIEVIDSDLSGYIRNDQLNYGRTFFIDAKLAKYTNDFTQCHELQSTHIWNLSKLSRFFIDNNYDLPVGYKNTVLSVNYKMNLIEGFLKFANLYINNKFSDGMYWEELLFYKTENFDAIVDEKFKEDKKIIDLEISLYETHLIKFIQKYLYDKNADEIKSKDMCNELFKLIDSIIIKKPERSFMIETFYDECFVIEYESVFFCLNKIWGS